MAKIAALVNRNNLIYEMSCKDLKHAAETRDTASHPQPKAGGELNSLAIKCKNSKDLTDEERKQRSLEILGMYRSQIQDKLDRERRRDNHKKLVERVLVEKQSQMSVSQINAERVNDLKKKAKQKKDLDTQIQFNRQLHNEDLCAIYD